jgi:hypothetical protein
MHSNDPGVIRLATDVLDEIIPAIPVGDGTPALIARIRECLLKAAAEGQASYQSLVAVASAEMGAMQARPSNGKRLG